MRSIIGIYYRRVAEMMKEKKKKERQDVRKMGEP